MKIVGTSLYIHKSALHQLLDKIKNIQDCLRIVDLLSIVNEENIDYTIVKYDKKTKNLSFIYSPDWDIANEPSVGDSICFNQNNERKIIKGSNKIYHNKYLFVDSTYKGFDIEEAKKRSQLWNSIPKIEKHKTRIGNKQYWIDLLKEHNIPI